MGLEQAGQDTWSQVETGVKATFLFSFFLKGKENGFFKKYFQLLVTEEEEEEDVICYLKFPEISRQVFVPYLLDTVHIRCERNW